jgi:sugar O-acyltransferase (sialic acid O-acetyltransferase NeuD family)
LVIFGSGGIARETAFLIEEINLRMPNRFLILGFIESDTIKIGERLGPYKILCSDDAFPHFSKSFPQLGVVLPFGNPCLKRKVAEKVNITQLRNLVYPNLIHPNVTFQKYSCDLGIGNIITSGVRLTVNVTLGNFNLLNLNTTVGHDAKIGNYNVINPLSAISGGVIINDEVLVGTGAKILQNLMVNSRVTIGAGAVVTKNVAEGETVIGIPAKRKG